MRRLFVSSSCAVVLALASAVLFAQTPPTQQQQQQQQQQDPQQQQQAQQQTTPPTAFASEAGLIFNQIKPDHAAQFEQAMARIKEALQKSTDPVRKQQAAGWKVYKAAEPMGQNVLYVFYMDPAVKGADYEMFKILQEALGDQTAREIFKELAASYAAGQNIINLTQIQDFSAAGGM